MENVFRNHVKFSTNNSYGYPEAVDVLKFVDLIADVLGIHIRHSQLDGFHKKISQRAQALKLSSLEEYYQFLSVKNKLDAHKIEWRKLIDLLTITESYFFRDQGQISLLKNQILPEIIERKRRLNALPNYASTGDRAPLKPTLRLWSAGCSTGEEAYSLAILLKDLLPDYQHWDLLILGTDVNQSAIEWAKRGLYSNWSFRTTEQDVRDRYFRSCKDGWEISSHVRSMVTFLPGNLVQDPYPNPGSKICDFDLILCRNVFIYFDAKTIKTTLNKFYYSLVPQGFLLTGHMELQGQTIEPFQIRLFSQSALYQRPASQPLHSNNIEAKKERTIPKKLKQNDSVRTIHFTQSTSSIVPSQIRSIPSNHSLGELEKLLAQKAYSKVIEQAAQLQSKIPNSLRLYSLKAEAYASLGDYFRAKQSCQEALHIDPLAIEPYYLLAQIAEVQGDYDGAKVFLKRIIYLAPTSVYAYFELGALYRHEGNTKQAQKVWRSSLDLLQGLPNDQPVDSRNRFTVFELKARILQYLDEIKVG